MKTDRENRACTACKSDGFGRIEQQPDSRYLVITEMMETGCFRHGGKMRGNRHELKELQEERFRLAIRKAVTCWKMNPGRL